MSAPAGTVERAGLMARCGLVLRSGRLMLPVRSMTPVLRRLPLVPARVPLLTPLLVPALVLAGCTQQMDDQPRYEALEAAAGFPHDQAALKPVAGTVSRSWTARPPAEDNPRAITPALLARGRDLYEAICAPCHGLAGYGDGMVVRRGFPAPPSYHQTGLRAASDGYLFDVITQGYGVMYSYANRVRAPDRWALIAYLRALQLSQWAEADTLGGEAQAALEDLRGQPDRLRPEPAREHSPERPPLPEVRALTSVRTPSQRPALRSTPQPALRSDQTSDQPPNRAPIEMPAWTPAQSPTAIPAARAAPAEPVAERPR